MKKWMDEWLPYMCVSIGAGLYAEDMLHAAGLCLMLQGVIVALDIWRTKP